ncbi:MAG: helix-turn-helix domain-containing protein [Myxococcota bacterium]
MVSRSAVLDGLGGDMNTHDPLKEHDPEPRTSQDLAEDEVLSERFALQESNENSEEGANGPDPGTSSSAIASSCLSFALMCGVPLEEIEALTGLSPWEIASEGVMRDDVPPRILRTVLDSGLRSAPSLEMAEMVPLLAFGGLDFAAPYAPTPLDAIKLNVEFADRIGDRVTMRTEESEGFLSLHFSHPCDPLDNGLIHEVNVIKTWWLIRRLMGPGGRLAEVSLGFSPNGTMASYEAAFGAPVSFGRFGLEHTLVFHKADLDVDSVGGNSNLFHLGRLYLQEQRRLHEERFVSRKMRHLQSTITSCVARRVFGVKQVAKEAFMSVRSAQRLASEQGTTLSKLIERARLEHARTLMLADPKISNSRLSVLLGYRDERSLNRAFKRRTGLTPAQFKRIARTPV